MSKSDQIKQDLAAATPEWYDNGNEIVSKQNPKVGIGGFLKEEDNRLAAQAPEYIAYLLADNERMYDENLSLRRSLTSEAVKDANYNVEIVRLRKELEEARFALEEIAEHGGVNLRGASCAELARAYLGQEGEGNHEQS